MLKAAYQTCARRALILRANLVSMKALRMSCMLWDGGRYAPNARSNVLKLKAEFIPGLGDTVTLLLLGARTLRRQGKGNAGTAAHSNSQFLLGAYLDDGARRHELVWLCHTSALPWRDGLSAPSLHQLWHRLTIPSDRADSKAPSLMRPLGPEELPPAWLGGCPTAPSLRPHYVLREPRAAPVVEVRDGFMNRCLNQLLHRLPNMAGAWLSVPPPLPDGDHRRLKSRRATAGTCHIRHLHSTARRSGRIALTRVRCRGS